MSFRSRFLLVVASATLALYAVVGSWMSTRAQSPRRNDPGEQLRIFESVLYHIQNDYVDEPDLTKVRAGALRGLAYGLDPYSTYLTAEQVKGFKNGSASYNASIGAELSQVASYLYVIAPVKGAPADQAGLRAGDIIEYIDNKATRDISLYDAQQLLNGAAGTAVKLRIIRQGTREITVKRGNVQVPTVETKIEPDKIGILRINSLAEGEATDVRNRVAELQKQGVTKIVLDMRSTAGGVLDEAVKVANFFIADGAIAQTLGRGNRPLKTFNADPKLKIFDGQVIALVDRGTAGAAEVIASALMERKRGEVVGEKTFGAGAEQQLFTLRGGDALLLTTTKWASLGGKAFLGEGITPTVEVKRPELAEAVDPDALSGNDDDELAQPETTQLPTQTAPTTPAPAEDVQLKKALEILRTGKTAAAKAA